MKKFFVGLLAVAAVMVVLPLFAAFEAHVINVTAKIENALSVNTNALDFGTVFPQEHLAKNMEVSLSSSFQAEPRVDQVSYFIRQKPKCAITSNNGESFDAANTRTGEVIPDGEGGYDIDCGPEPRTLQSGESWGVLPSLCEYVSKAADIDVPNDETLFSFHEPWAVDPTGNTVVWRDTRGVLSKTVQDTTDNWVIDLAVPCFGGYCAQDWADFVHRVGNDNSINADKYVQPAGNEHKVFGCDLWVEVNGVNAPVSTPE